MKRPPVLLLCAAIFAGGLFLAGCATGPGRTENLLGQAGFRRVAATTPAQLQRLQTLPADKLTVAKLNGKKFYVFPDPAKKILYVGNLEQYQSYEQLLDYYQLTGQNRVETSLGDEGAENDTVRWAEWTSQTGWTGGGY